MTTLTNYIICAINPHTKQFRGFYSEDNTSHFVSRRKATKLTSKQARQVRDKLQHDWSELLIQIITL